MSNKRNLAIQYALIALSASNDPEEVYNQREYDIIKAFEAGYNQKPIEPTEAVNVVGVPYKCPICEGKGNVPGGFYLSSPGIGSTSVNIHEQCRQCSGQGIIYSNPPKQTEQRRQKIENIMKESLKASEELIKEEPELVKQMIDKFSDINEPNQSEAVDLEGILSYEINKYDRGTFKHFFMRNIDDRNIAIKAMQAAIEQDRKVRNKTN